MPRRIRRKFRVVFGRRRRRTSYEPSSWSIRLTNLQKVHLSLFVYTYGLYYPYGFVLYVELRQFPCKGMIIMIHSSSFFVVSIQLKKKEKTTSLKIFNIVHTARQFFYINKNVEKFFYSISKEDISTI